MFRRSITAKRPLKVAGIFISTVALSLSVAMPVHADTVTGAVDQGRFFGTGAGASWDFFSSDGCVRTEIDLSANSFIADGHPTGPTVTPDPSGTILEYSAVDLCAGRVLFDIYNTDAPQQASLYVRPDAGAASIQLSTFFYDGTPVSVNVTFTPVGSNPLQTDHTVIAGPVSLFVQTGLFKGAQAIASGSIVVGGREITGGASTDSAAYARAQGHIVIVTPTGH
ncbi:hypothetical protein ACX801_07895 [Arthrobacter bambusae]